MVLPCDTSPDGGGTVGSDRLAEGSEKPTSYISRTSTKTERNDAQFETEALGRIFGKWNQIDTVMEVLADKQTLALNLVFSLSSSSAAPVCWLLSEVGL